MRKSRGDVGRRGCMKESSPRYPSNASPNDCCLHALDVRRVKVLRTRLNLELYFLSLGERLEAIHGDGREMHENVFATLLLDETETLGIVEPLHLALCHRHSPARGSVASLALAAT